MSMLRGVVAVTRLLTGWVMVSARVGAQLMMPSTINSSATIATRLPITALMTVWRVVSNWVEGPRRGREGMSVMQAPWRVVSCQFSVISFQSSVISRQSGESGVGSGELAAIRDPFDQPGQHSLHL